MTIQPVKVEAAQAPASAAAQFVEAYRAAAQVLPGAGSAWAAALRETAADTVLADGLPHRRIEEWKYTDLRASLRNAFPPADPAARLTRAQLEAALGPLAVLDAHLAVFVNGEFAPDLARLERLPNNVRAHTARHLLNHPQDWFEASLGKVYPQENDFVGALNAALMTDGALIRIGEGVKLEAPIHLVFATTAGAPMRTCVRNMILAGPGAQATVIETYIGVGDAPLQTIAVTEADLAAGARLAQIKLQMEPPGGHHLANWHVRLADGADYQGAQYVVGGGLSRLQTFVRYAGEGARAHFAGAQLLRGEQHCDMTMVIDHAVPCCESREHVKAVLADKAQGVFQAKVIVRPDAQKTDGRQIAQALMLSNEAEFDSKPELEIYADDVKCNHGSTVGELDEDMLFYLRARGIGESEAKALLIEAFIGEILEKVEHEALREALTAKTERWLAA